MAGSYTLPTRVIDIGDNSREPRLFEPNGLVGRWLALSHCWGGSQPLTTTTGTLSARKTGIPLEEFPPLFKDAISVTRRLGHQYLWIDSLCIIQDSKDDWLAESSKMGDIYKHSTLTLVTEGIKSCNESFFEKANVDREKHSRGFLSCGATSQLHKGSSIFLRGAPHKPAEGYVSRRAWALQEDILSPRLLILTTDMVRWECQGTKYAEDRPDDNYNIPGHLPDTPKIIILPEKAMRRLKGGPINTYPADSNAFGLLWSGIVQRFASRSITYETDRLPAISALARQLGKQAFGQRSPPVQWRYLAGLWEQDIHAGLLWSTNGQATRYDTYVAPSWSWASLDMTKKNNSKNETYVGLDIMYCNWDYRAKLVAAEIETSDLDPFGQVSRGYLQLESAFRRADSFSQERIKWLDINDRLDPKSPQSIVMAGFIACCLDISNDLQLGELKSSQAGNRVFFQIMARTDNHKEGKDWVYALILEPANDDKLYFRRVGLASFPMYLAAYSDALSNCWDIQTVTIV
jgi:hypothetical protein